MADNCTITTEDAKRLAAALRFIERQTSSRPAPRRRMVTPATVSSDAISLRSLSGFFSSESSDKQKWVPWIDAWPSPNVDDSGQMGNLHFEADKTAAGGTYWTGHAIYGPYSLVADADMDVLVAIRIMVRHTASNSPDLRGRYYHLRTYLQSGSDWYQPFNLHIEFADFPQNFTSYALSTPVSTEQYNFAATAVAPLRIQAGDKLRWAIDRFTDAPLGSELYDCSLSLTPTTLGDWDYEALLNRGNGPVSISGISES